MPGGGDRGGQIFSARYFAPSAQKSETAPDSSKGVLRDFYNPKRYHSWNTIKCFVLMNCCSIEY